jgi:preprotein translocase subunit YajC
MVSGRGLPHSARREKTKGALNFAARTPYLGGRLAHLQAKAYRFAQTWGSRPFPNEVMMLFSPAYAQAAGAAGSSGSIIGGLMPLLLMIPIFYFLLIRPQQKKMKEHRAMMDALRRGDQIVTQGGIIAKVAKVNEDGTLEAEIAEGVKVKILKHTIVTVMNKTEPAAKA